MSKHQLPQYTSTQSLGRLSRSNAELVAAPQLGQEWGEDEDRKPPENEKDLARKAKRQKRKENLQGFARGRDKYCGWFGWKQALALGLLFVIGYGVFRISLSLRLTLTPLLFCDSLAVALYFVIPRKPKFQLNTLEPVGNAPGGPNPVFARVPMANFSFDVVLNLGGQLDPTRLTPLELPL
jgi:hypothetical protein